MLRKLRGCSFALVAGFSTHKKMTTQRIDRPPLGDSKASAKTTDERTVVDNDVTNETLRFY